MEKRRKALGLRKLATPKDRDNIKEETPKKLKSSSRNVTRIPEEKTLSKVDGSSSLPDCITSQHRTPKRHALFVQSTESPNLGSMLPRMLSSPEVEVSWDWGCSQVPKDMMSSRGVKRGSPKQPSAVLSPLIQEPRMVQTRHISEEENQARLAFYKNVLSQASKCEMEENVTSNKLDAADNEASPKGSTKEDKASLSSLFDDSMNELMLECSQAIEEQLKNGEIAPVVDKKHALSPDCEQGNGHKRFHKMHAKTKLQLFSEAHENTNIESHTESEKPPPIWTSPTSVTLKNHSSCTKKSQPNHIKENTSKGIDYTKSRSVLEDRTDVKNSLINRPINSCITNISSSTTRLRLNDKSGSEVLNQPNCNALETRQGISLNNNSIKYNNYTQSKQIQENKTNMKYDSVDKFRRNSKRACDTNINKNIYPSNNDSKNVINLVPTEIVKRNTSINHSKTNLTHNFEETKQNVADITSLLDDGFDMELSSLDVDSICRNSQAPAVPRVCTKAEIEAKRMAALAKLKTKMKR